MKATKGNKAKMKKISMIMTGIAAVILSGALCTAQAVHASGEDISVPEAVTYEEAVGSQEGNWPVDVDKSDCSIDLLIFFWRDTKPDSNAAISVVFIYILC